MVINCITRFKHAMCVSFLASIYSTSIFMLQNRTSAAIRSIFISKYCFEKRNQRTFLIMQGICLTVSLFSRQDIVARPRAHSMLERVEQH